MCTTSLDPHRAPICKGSQRWEHLQKVVLAQAVHRVGPASSITHESLMKVHDAVIAAGCSICLTLGPLLSPKTVWMPIRQSTVIRPGLRLTAPPRRRTSRAGSFPEASPPRHPKLCRDPPTSSTSGSNTADRSPTGRVGLRKSGRGEETTAQSKLDGTATCCTSATWRHVYLSNTARRNPIPPPLVCVASLWLIYYATHVRGYAVLPGVDVRRHMPLASCGSLLRARVYLW